MESYNNIPNTVFEIGVGDLGVCRSRPFWGLKTKCFLFEPHPDYYNQLKRAAKPFKNVKVYNVAISDKEGYSELYLANNCSFLKGINSPIFIQDETKDDINKLNTKKVKTECITKYDGGDIDLLFLDTEGSEWFVLKNLKSRPKMIIIETHIRENNPPYLNFNLDNILFWMWCENYYTLCKQGNDTVFQRWN